MAGGFLSRRIALLGLAGVGLLLASALWATGAVAQEGERGSIPGLTLTGDNPGELVISWGDPDPAPSDYRIAWAPEGEGYLSYQADNDARRGNAYPAGAARSYTVSGLPEGAEYKVRMRARFSQGGDNPWSGPWAHATITLAATPTPTATPEPTPDPTPVASDAVTGLTLTGDAPGDLTATWNAPVDAPDDYRVVWSKVGESWPSWRSDDGTAYPATTTLTITELDPGVEYRVRVRARYGQNTSNPRSSPWTEPSVASSGAEPALLWSHATTVRELSAGSPYATLGFSHSLSHRTDRPSRLILPDGGNLLVFSYSAAGSAGGPSTWRWPVRGASSTTTRCSCGLGTLNWTSRTPSSWRAMIPDCGSMPGPRAARSGRPGTRWRCRFTTCPTGRRQACPRSGGRAGPLR